MQALVAPHMPQLAVIAGFQSLDEFFSNREKLEHNEEYRKGFEAGKKARKRRR